MGHNNARKEFRVSLIPPPGAQDNDIRAYIKTAIETHQIVTARERGPLDPMASLDVALIKITRAYR